MANKYQIFSQSSPINTSGETITVDKFWNQLKINTCTPAKAYFIIALTAAIVTGIIGTYSTGGVISQICIVSCMTLFLMGLCQIPYAGKTISWVFSTCLAIMVISGTVNTVSCWMNGSSKDADDDVVYIEE